MRLYIRGDFKKKIPFGYEELAHKMWAERINGKELSISHSVNDEMLQEDNYLSLSYNKWDNDDRWDSESITMLSSFLTMEYLHIEFENAFISDYREKGNYLRLISNHQNILTVDKRAFYIMAIEVATALDGQISEDDKKTWIMVEEFTAKHSDILSLTFDEANEISLKEMVEMEQIDEPLWAELERQREEYIKIHGERVYDDEDEPFEDEDDDREYWDYDEETGELILLNVKETDDSDEKDDDEEVFGF
ncbi:TPA: hypothetical protein ACGO3A_001154 [Streptococcus suis]